MRNLEEEMSNMIERDPVSGNEVPPGAMPKEVRDDVDAKLSDGEYVLPADVVRFYGVQHIEKMVMKAKEGMNEMVANGRVNGEEPTPMDGKADPRIASRDPRQQAPQPVPRQMSGGGYNFLPQDGSQPVQYPAMTQDGLSAAEELRKRQEAPVEMAEGGYTSAANQIMGNQSYGTGANQILNTGGVSGFDAVRSMGRGFYGTNAVGGAGGMGSGGVETRTYINKAGERISVMFINGTPIADIPDGYVPDTPEGRKQFEQAVVGSGEDVAAPEVDEDGRDNRESNGWNDQDKGIAPEDNYFGMSAEQLSAVGEAPNGMAMKGLAGMGIAGAAVGAINAVRQGEYLADLRARATAAKELGYTEAATALESMAADFAEEVPQAVKWAEKFGGVTGEGILKKHAEAFQGYTEQQVLEGTYLGQGGGTPETGATGTTGATEVETAVDQNGTPISAGPLGTGGQWNTKDPNSSPSDLYDLGGQRRGVGRNMDLNPVGQTGGTTGLNENPWGFMGLETPAGFSDAAVLRGSKMDTQNGRARVNSLLPPDRAEAPAYTRMPEEIVSSNRIEGLADNFNTRSVDNSSGAEDRRAEERARETSSRQASGALNDFDNNVNEVVRDAQNRGASRAETDAIRDEAENIRDALENRERGLSVGFAKGGLVARKAMRPTKSRRKIRTVER